MKNKVCAIKQTQSPDSPTVINTHCQRDAQVLREDLPLSATLLRELIRLLLSVSPELY